MRILDWDSQFFGRRIGRLDELTPDWRARALAEGLECLYLLVDAGEQATIGAAEAAGFRLMDVRMTLARALGSAPPRPPASRVRLARPDDQPRLESLAAQAHHDTRFYADPNFSPARVDDMYRRWIAKSMARPGGAVWVLDEGEGAAGYTTCDPEGSIGLVAVAPAARGRAGGRDLVEASLFWFQQAGRERVEVVTQGRNVVAQRLYQRCGFQTSRMELWFHLWL